MPRLRSLTNKKTGKDLNILDEVQADWSSIVDYLELPSKTVKQLRGRDDEEAVREVFERWLNGNGETSVDWNTVIQTIQKVKKKLFAEEVREALLS